MNDNRADSYQPRLLVDPKGERSSCGVGAIMDLKGDRKHSIVEKGIEMLENMIHRGAIGIEEEAGDGSGIMLQMPDEFFREVIPVDLPDQYGTGLVFSPQDGKETIEIKNLIEQKLLEQGLEVKYWRGVPTDNRIIPQNTTKRRYDLKSKFRIV